jgi:hypothetical protein
MKKPIYPFLIFICTLMILGTGCTSTSNTSSTSPTSTSFGGEWHAITATIPAEMSSYYSIRSDGTWSYGSLNGNGTKDEASHGTYTIDGNTAHFTDLVFTDEPFDLTINDTGYINEHDGAQGTDAYNDVVTYAKVSDVAGAAATLTPTSSNQVASNSLSPADNAAANKQTEMLTYISPLMKTTGSAMTSGDYATARENAVTLRDYIDQNQPEMQQLATNANTIQPAAQEFVLALTNLRAGADDIVKGVDDYNSGDTTDATTIWNTGTGLMQSANSHLQNATYMEYWKQS